MASIIFGVLFIFALSIFGVAFWYIIIILSFLGDLNHLTVEIITYIYYVPVYSGMVVFYLWIVNSKLVM